MDSTLDYPVMDTHHHFLSRSHSGTILEGLNSLRNRSLLFDVSLLVEGVKLDAHKVVLASCSDYFRAMFTDAMLESRQDEINLNGVTANGMGYLIEYAYTSKLSLNLDNVQDVLSAASHVQMNTAFSACSEFLSSRLTCENCIDIGTIAERYSIHSLVRTVYRFISKNLLAVSSTTRFAEINSDQICHLLKGNFVTNVSELDILTITLQWVSHDPDVRLDVVPKLFKSIQFGNISGSSLGKLIQHNALLKRVIASFLQVDATFEDVQLSHLDGNKITLCKEHAVSIAGLVNQRGYGQAVLKIGGFSPSQGLTDSIWYCHGTTTAVWQKLTNIPNIDHVNCGAAVLNNELYIMGGSSTSTDLEDFAHPLCCKYSPGEDNWTTIARMSQDRARFYLGTVGRHIYAIGGATVSDADEHLVASSSCEKYDPPTNQWTRIHSLPDSRMQHAGAVSGSLIFVSGGLENNTVLQSMYCYDTELETWSVRSPLLSPRVDHNMVAHEDRIYVVGGWRENEQNGNRTIVDSVDCYEIQTDTWSTVARLPSSRYHTEAVIIQGVLYILGGYASPLDVLDSGVVKAWKMDILDLSTDSWLSNSPLIPSFPENVWEHSCCLLHIPLHRDGETWRNKDIAT